MSVLITAPYHEKGQQEIETLFGPVVYRPWKPKGRAYNEEELMALLKETNATALITEHDHVTANVINAFPNLTFIGVCRGTPSNLAIDAAREHGIAVFHTPARNAQAVAELFIANVITMLRNLPVAENWLTAGNWEAGAHTSYLQFKGHELAGKTVGMVGFGAIGQTIARILKTFPCTICYYDPYYTDPDTDYRKMTLPELFAGSDIVSIHLPDNKETAGMISAGLFGKMKPDSIFVNTARAAVVNRDDLLTALEQNKIGGAILDVFNHEPPDETDYKIIHHPHVLATPHIAGASFEVEDHHVEILNRQLKTWKKTAR